MYASARRLAQHLVVGVFLACLIAIAAVMPLHAQIPGFGAPTPVVPETSEPAPAPSKTDALIELLQDDAARQELIDKLKAANEAVPPEGDPTSEAEAEPTPDPPRAPVLTRALNAVVTWLETDVPAFFARLKRAPSTFTLAEQALANPEIERAIWQSLMIAALAYVVLSVFYFLFRPLRRKLNTAGADAKWLRLLWLRLLSTVISVVPVAFGFLAGIAAAVLVTETTGASELTVSTFLEAFLAIEGTRIVIRFVLSPTSSNLRLLDIPDGGARSLMRICNTLLIILGYGQLFLVPIVTDVTSIFFGRAVSSLLGALTILYLVLVVIMKRRAVEGWINNRFGASTLGSVAAFMASWWHVPALAYLFALFIIVITRPGNVLLPLIWTSLASIAILVIGLMTSDLIQQWKTRSIKLPEFVSQRLPMLETRLNRALPAVLDILGVVVGIIVLGALLDLVGIFDFSGFTTSEVGSRWVSAAISAFLLICGLYFVHLIVASWVDYRLNPFVGEAPTPRLVTLLTLLRNAITIALIVVGSMIVLSELGLNIGPLLASAGVLGLAISFGAQRMVEDIITGVFIQMENAMNVGDVVNVGGVVGTVEKLTVRSVTLRDLQGVVHMIPFSSASKISNYMREFSYYVCDMGIAYREDIAEAKQAMFDAFDQLRSDPDQGPFLLGELEWFGLDSFGDNAVVLRARIKTIPGMQWSVKRAYNAYVKQIFDERGIEIPFPHRTLYFGEDKQRNAPPVRVAFGSEDQEPPS